VKRSTGSQEEAVGRRFGFIGSPSSAGAFSPGQEKAPRALRVAGLLNKLRAAGVGVADHGDLPVRRWQPDPLHPRAQNLSTVRTNALEVAAAVRRSRAVGEIPLVLGGDCTVALGMAAGQVPGAKRLGLIYFDLHADLNTPDSVPDGALDWMGMAHMLAEPKACPELRNIGQYEPLLDDDQVLFFAHDPAHATAWERDLMTRRSLSRIPLDEVAASPERAARDALDSAEREWDRLLLHFDVDTIDFTDAPLSENAGRNYGLSLAAAFTALRVLAQSPRLAGITVAELNPDHSDLATIRRFIDGLVGALRGLRPGPHPQRSAESDSLLLGSSNL